MPVITWFCDLAWGKRVVKQCFTLVSKQTNQSADYKKFLSVLLSLAVLRLLPANEKNHPLKQTNKNDQTATNDKKNTIEKD